MACGKMFVGWNFKCEKATALIESQCFDIGSGFRGSSLEISDMRVSQVGLRKKRKRVPGFAIQIQK